MDDKRTSPRWLRVLFVIGLVGTLGGFVGSAAFAALHEWPDRSAPPMLYVRLVSSAVVCTGITFGLGLVHTAFKGSYYSGIARRRVTRGKDALHFWAMLGILGLLPLALIAYGIFRFVTA